MRKYTERLFWKGLCLISLPFLICERDDRVTVPSRRSPLVLNLGKGSWM